MLLKKPPTEKDIRAKYGNKKLSADETVALLYAEQWGFYKHGYETMFKIAGYQLIIIILLMISVSFFAIRGTPRPDYFAQDTNGRITKLEPLSEPIKSDEQIKQFVKDAVLASLNFSYADYELRKNDSAKFYTDDGSVAFEEALKRSNILDQVKTAQLLLSTTWNGNPVIDKSKSGDTSGTYIWVVDADLTMELSNGSQKKAIPAKMSFYVVRVPSLERAEQVAIYRVKQKLN